MSLVFSENQDQAFAAPAAVRAGLADGQASSMGWRDVSLPPTLRTCPYCARPGLFQHAKSFEYAGEVVSLHACPECGSLLYAEPAKASAVPTEPDVMTPEAARAARYVLEAGFSAHHVCLCGLFALPDLPAAELSRYIFLDIGAGMGMGSYFMRSVFGTEIVAIEPSFTGRLAADILGLPVHRAALEDLPAAVLEHLSERPCILHLNSVIEHLDDPSAALGAIISRIQVASIAILAPDAAALDFDGPLTSALPYLSPHDHRTLPTSRGLEVLLQRLGFEHRLVQKSPGLLIAAGSRRPIAAPGERTVRLAELLLLERLMRHPHPEVRAGGAARLLPAAAMQRDETLLAVLRRALPYEDDCDRWLECLARGDWDAIPYHLGPTCYWLAYDASSAGRRQPSLALLDITEAFADELARAQPRLAMTPLMFKWAGLILRAQILCVLGDHASAVRALEKVTQSHSDAQRGAGAAYIAQAEAELQKLRTPIPEETTRSPRDGGASVRAGLSLSLAGFSSLARPLSVSDIV